MVSKIYLNAKLSEAIYILTTHEGDARLRLRSVIPKLKFLTPSNVPRDLKKDVIWINETIRRGLGRHYKDSPSPMLSNINNATASKVIARIVKIQDRIDQLVDIELK
jgi:hypothetical protein